MTHPKRLCDLETPCFVVDKQRVENNCVNMKTRCDKMGVSLRPMMKTHKCLEAGLLATGGTRRCISTSTVAEAEFFADGGFDDILLTVIFTQDKINRMKALLGKLSVFHVMVDSEYGVQLLEDNVVSGKKWSAFIMIDCGDKRSGQVWDSPGVVTLAKRIQQSAHLDLAGIYVHDGGSYGSKSAAEVKEVGREETNRLLTVSKRLREAGVDLKTVGIGSTPTSSSPSDNMAQLTELHPGNYIFYDAQQMLLGSCKATDVAGRVATRVTGHYPHRNQILVDAGFLATSHDGKDKIPNGGSFCMVENEPNLILVNVNQEVGFISAEEGDLDCNKYPIGSMLYLLPWHSCATAAMHDKYYVHEGEEIKEVWVNSHYW